ncbi:MAG: flagellar biosynthetic protein FliR [Sphingomonadaceae bacterium]|uniref:flagellar biosynthetic protein FliR n=1 Tax=Thermaurantiacus sp. TaxID=2820283 RepID=UPI00298F1CE5|nr:flagellar biosynthetic protein FliR [Thermaurantiacus sp.]MCS6987001.1 flagellar biosynthetic protein FliR [Sphingomonadaceae bacterium]MDW8415661.1 flagellar biosynthetic protein FliR [Thermaurantiacus sp.]
MTAGDIPAVLLAPERFLLELLWCSLRTGTALTLLPAVGGQVIPLQARIGVAFAVGALVRVSPAAPEPPADPLGPAGLAALAGELLVGLVLALALHAAFAAAVIAGEWAGQMMGLGYATLVSPGAGPTPVLAVVFSLVMWGVFLGSGGHLLLLGAILQSYRTLPDPALLLEGRGLDRILAWGGFAMASGVMAALPLTATLLLLNLLLAIAARSAPQLNLFAVGFPLMLATGLVALPLALPGLADTLAGTLTTLQRDLSELTLG